MKENLRRMWKEAAEMHFKTRWSGVTEENIGPFNTEDRLSLCGS
jgi:hypothetical protein